MAGRTAQISLIPKTWRLEYKWLSHCDLRKLSLFAAVETLNVWLVLLFLHLLGQTFGGPTFSQTHAVQVCHTQKCI